MTQFSLITALDGLIRVERVAPGEESLVKGLLRQAVPYPEGAPHFVVFVTASEHDVLGGVRAVVMLFDGCLATFQILPSIAQGGPPRVQWLDSQRQAPFGFDRLRNVWRRYPELALVTGEAREALDRFDVEGAEAAVRAEQRREAARRAVETRRLNRLAREAAAGGRGGA